MNMNAILQDILQELHELRNENAALHAQLTQLQAKVELLEHKVDSVAEEMGMI